MRLTTKILAFVALGLSLPAVAGPNLPVVVELHPDLRDCLYPICGGWFVERVNHADMRCADGTMQPQCYVLEVDWAALGLDPVREAELVAAAYRDEVIVRGRGYRVPVAGFGDFAGLTPSAAWTAFLP